MKILGSTSVFTANPGPPCYAPLWIRNQLLMELSK